MQEMSRDEKRKYIVDNIVTTEEACEIIGRTRQQLITIIKKGHIPVAKKTTNGNIFLKDDILFYKHWIMSCPDYILGFEDAVREHRLKVSKPEKIEDFVREVTADIKDSTNFSFVLKKFSKKEPYWCVFACKMDENHGIINCGGHYCPSIDVRLSEILDVLASSGWKTEIQSGFFIDWDN